MSKNTLANKMKYPVESIDDINRKIAKTVNGWHRMNNMFRSSVLIPIKDLSLENMISRQRIDRIIEVFDTLEEPLIGNGRVNAKVKRPIGIYQLKSLASDEYFMHVAYTKEKLLFASEFRETWDFQFASVEDAKAYIDQLDGIQYDTDKQRALKEKAKEKAQAYINERLKEENVSQQGE